MFYQRSVKVEARLLFYCFPCLYSHLSSININLREMSLSTNQSPHTKPLTNDNVWIKDTINRWLSSENISCQGVEDDFGEKMWKFTSLFCYREWSFLTRMASLVTETRARPRRTGSGRPGWRPATTLCSSARRSGPGSPPSDQNRARGRSVHSLGNKWMFNHCIACLAHRRAKYHISQFFWFTNCYLTPSYPEDVANEIHSNGQMFLLLFQEFDWYFLVNFMRRNLGSRSIKCIDPSHWHPLTLVYCHSKIESVSQQILRPSS